MSAALASEDKDPYVPKHNPFAGSVKSPSESSVTPDGPERSVA